MPRKLLFALLIIVLVMLPFFTACPAETSPSPTAATSTPSGTATPTAEANWWDKYGEPQYGGEIVFAPGRFHQTIDAYYAADYGASQYWLEPLWIPDWTLDREMWPFLGPFFPQDYVQGVLAESWEITDLQTVTVQIRQGVHWQDKEPVNGREFNAYDVEYHYDRFLGTGHGYTEPSAANIARMGPLEKVSATGEYTVVFKFKNPSVLNFENIIDPDGRNYFEAPEIVQQYGDTKDWKNAVGTGPWILTDYLEGTSFTYSRNPNYWGYDERHPDNQLPYADTLKVLYIPDLSTRLAALRTGKADFTDEVSFQHAETLSNSNPELLQASIPYIMTNGIDFRVDLEPFSDIRVRKAMQMAIDRESIAENYYKGYAEPIPCGPINPSSKGYCYPYDEWPAELQAEYSYNPDEAKALLAEAGYPNGFETTILFSTQDDQGIVEIVKAQLSDIGIEVEIDARDPTTARALGAAFDYEMSWNRNTGSTATPSSVVTMAKSTHSMNFNQVKDPAFDAMCDELDAADNIDDVKRLVADMDMYVLEHHWGIRLFPINTYNVWQPYLKGYSGEALTRMGNPGGWLWARFWIDQDLKK